MAINKEFRVKHGLIFEDDVIVNGSVTATSFIGDGSQLTGISSLLDKVTQDELIAERQKAREFIRANS